MLSSSVVSVTSLVSREGPLNPPHLPVFLRAVDCILYLGDQAVVSLIPSVLDGFEKLEIIERPAMPCRVAQ
jgi:hypothetical protein